ncbi:GNAT family N-acetyltransferase [Rhodobacteraceae bacterium F11138]|nr:GNAT family N-acetyltransferase [Rhodobacteraceae bacterium F11138]
MTRAIPNINTARLTLRAMRHEDFDRFAEIWAMPEVVRYLGGQPRSRRRAWEAFLRNAGHWQMTGFGQWAIVEQRSRKIIGQTGFFFGAQAVGEDFDPFPEARWLLVPDARRRGLAQEAVRAAHDWFDRVVPGPLVIQVAPDNETCLRLASEIGYSEMRRARVKGESVVLLRRNGPPPRAG